MCFIDVTLDVSKLSGWLNADAPCRVTRTAYMHTMRGEVRALCGSGRGTTVWVGCGASGGHAYNARRGRPATITRAIRCWRHASWEAEGRGAAAVHAACRRGPEWRSVGRGTRGAHKKHGVHGCDAGRVEAQRLVERRRFLPSRKEGIGGGRHASREAGRAWGGCGACGVQARARMGINGARCGLGQTRGSPRTCPAWSSRWMCPSSRCPR